MAVYELLINIPASDRDAQKEQVMQRGVKMLFY